MDKERVLAEAVVESITFMTGVRPRSRKRAVPFWLVSWVLFAFFIVGLLIWKKS